MRESARRRLPRAVFDYIDGGAEDETTLDRNSSAFGAYQLRARVLVDVSTRSLATTVCGLPLDLPFLIAPTGLSGMVHPDGELGGMRAALRHGTSLILSTAASYSMEEITRATGTAPWFQLYPTPVRDLSGALLDRAAAVGCPAAVVTVDCPIVGRRERDLRNGAALPPQPSLSNIVSLARHPRWVAGIVRGKRATMKNFEPDAGVVEAATLAARSLRLLDPSLTWDALSWIRDRWSGPLLVKGLMHPDDAREAVSRGADGVIVSNHGGRQLDGAMGTMEALGPVVDAVADRCDVLIDGGIRRGVHLVKALALGAKACLIGRPWLYGLAHGGTAGVDQTIEILSSELDRALALLGVPSVDQLERSLLAPW
ncbi:MAG: alpha-hydroxy acid oxidase [Acidimicrobiia bacterium]